ncbi:MAG: nucleotidyl transferase AbiEii/AbiGii toxin family protein, partial [Elusimicrobiota bacterium]
PSDVAQLLRALAELPELGRFYLAGGTALALQRGHRFSIDLDFFTDESEFDAAEHGALRKTLSRLGGYRLREDKKGTLHVVLRGVEVSFLYYPYPLVRAPLRWKGLRIASEADIGLMKAGAIIGRGARKDFRDLREIIRSLPLEALLRLGEKKFPDFEDFMFQASKALVYFADADTQNDPRLLKREPWSEVKSYFERETPRVFRGTLQR